MQKTLLPNSFNRFTSSSSSSEGKHLHHHHPIINTNQQQYSQSLSLSPPKKSKECQRGGLLPKLGGTSPERKRIKKMDEKQSTTTTTTTTIDHHNTHPQQQSVSAILSPNNCTSYSSKRFSSSNRFLDVMVSNQPISSSSSSSSSSTTNMTKLTSNSSIRKRSTRSNFNSTCSSGYQQVDLLNSSLPNNNHTSNDSSSTSKSSKLRRKSTTIKPRPSNHLTTTINSINNFNHSLIEDQEDVDPYEIAMNSSRDNLIKHLFKESNHDLSVHKELLLNPFKNHSTVDLPLVPRPQLPDLSESCSMFTKVLKIQNFISSFEYNYIEQHFFDITRLRPLKSILQTAREITMDCLPIRCVEGCFLSLLCTQEFDEVDRFSVFFQTSMTQRVYRHIVCLLRFKGRFGAIGLSRKSDLFYKPLMYLKMSEILREYILSYAKYGHCVQFITISLPISHDSSSKEIPMWNYLKLDFIKHRDNGIDILMEKTDQYMNQVTSTNGEKLLEKRRRKIKSNTSTSILNTSSSAVTLSDNDLD